MKAIILAGGAGTRLRHVIKDVPKPMALIAGKPFLEYLILQLAKWKIKDIILSVGYKSDIIKSYFNNFNHAGIRISYSEEKEPLGTGGAIRMAGTLSNDDNYLVMNGDSFLDINFASFVEFHMKKDALATMSLVRMADTGRYGRVELGNKGNVIKFTEKGQNKPGTINGGIYIFNRKIFNNIPSGNISLEKNVLPLLIDRGLYGKEAEGFFIDIGIPDDYFYLNRHPEKLVPTVDIQC